MRSQAFALTQNVPTEREEQIALFKYISLKSATYRDLELIYHIPNGAFLGAGRLRMGGILKMMGCKNGVPDIHVPIAGGAVSTFSYLSLYIELKRLKASPSGTTPEQIAFHSRLREHGHSVVVSRGWREAWNTICDYLNLEGEQID